MTSSIPIIKLLSSLGYSHRVAIFRAWDELTMVGLTTGKKTEISSAKEEKVRNVLERQFVLLCSKCQVGETNDHREVLPTNNGEDCTICGGSPNKVAVDRTIEAMKRNKIQRVLVVGGAPDSRKQLGELWPAHLNMRQVSGEERHTRKEASANIIWADVIVIWGGTELPHKISKLYTDGGETARGKIVMVRRRGIAALAEEICKHVDSV